jgi:hypothetical protein
MPLQRPTWGFGPKEESPIRPLGGSLHFRSTAAVCIAVVVVASPVLVSSADEFSRPGSGWISQSMGYLRLLDNGEYVSKALTTAGTHGGTWVDLGYAVELRPSLNHDSHALLRRVWFGPCEALVPWEGELSQRNAFWPAVRKCNPSPSAE